MTPVAKRRSRPDGLYLADVVETDDYAPVYVRLERDRRRSASSWLPLAICTYGWPEPREGERLLVRLRDGDVVDVLGQVLGPPS